MSRGTFLPVLMVAGSLLLLAGCGGEERPAPFLSSLRATADDPLYTTYAAAMERSQFLLDQGYQFKFHEPDRAIRFYTDTGGELGVAFRMEGRTVRLLREMHREPVITASYPDMVSWHWYPFDGIRAEATFLVRSSRSALWELRLRNESDSAASVQTLPYMRMEPGQPPFREVSRAEGAPAFHFRHTEEPDGWTRSHEMPHVTEVFDAFAVSDVPASSFSVPQFDELWEDPAAGMGESTAIAGDDARAVAFTLDQELDPGESAAFRLVRLVSDSADAAWFRGTADTLFSESLKPYLRTNEELFAGAPELQTDDPDRLMLYWSAWNMMRQVFYPPEGRSSYNWYVFSREPTWGWGHGGQVFHESITMQAYALLDPQGAMNSQRVFSERQHENGYINYRTGAYLDEVIRHEGELTSSAPWYNWINWEVYKITGDRDFLREMYASGRRFYEFYVSNRDKDGDGLAEWGGHAVLESVRDSEVAVWDEVGWPANFEGVDVNSMLVMEEKALGNMAAELGLQGEARGWENQAARRSDLINGTMWDEKNGFYYNVDMRDNNFTFEHAEDLKRDEIIGFLPLWAGVASEAQARRLVRKLTDPEQFWRPYGVPSLSAADPYYDPQGYWNGPVWVEWDYLVMQGLLEYGYREEARELVRRVAENMIGRLKADHTFWEFYSPDESWGGYHQTYIWAGIINRMMLDVFTSPNDTLTISAEPPR